MREIVRTNDTVLVSAIQALLNAAEIPHLVLDQNMSVLEGSLGILPRRILVGDEHQESARRLLEDAGLAHELRPGSETDGRTDDAVLGGRLRLTQKRTGHRFGHDAILLAAATGARRGDHAVDLGAGVGAAVDGHLLVASWLPSHKSSTTASPIGCIPSRVLSDTTPVTLIAEQLQPRDPELGGESGGTGTEGVAGTGSLQAVTSPASKNVQTAARTCFQPTNHLTIRHPGR